MKIKCMIDLLEERQAREGGSLTALRQQGEDLFTQRCVIKWE